MGVVELNATNIEEVMTRNREDWNLIDKMNRKIMKTSEYETVKPSTSVAR